MSTTDTIYQQDSVTSQHVMQAVAQPRPHPPPSGWGGEQRELRSVGQDKDRRRDEPSRTIYPGPAKPTSGPAGKTAEKTVRPDPQQKKASFHVWLDQAVGVELRHLAQLQGVSISATTNALLKDSLQQAIHQQHDALLEPLVTKTLRKEQRQQRRLILLTYLELIRSRRILVNLLARTKPQRAMDAETLDRIIDSTMKQARHELFSRQSPFDEETRREILEWLQAITPAPDGDVGKEEPA
jgi:hypothetical protein